MRGDTLGWCITTRPGMDPTHISTNGLADVHGFNTPFLEYFFRRGPGIVTRNFGVYYDPRWVEELYGWQPQTLDHRGEGGAFPNRNAILSSLSAIASRSWRADTLWLVDCDLQSTFGAEELMSNGREDSSTFAFRQVFYAEGRRLIEVSTDDLGARWKQPKGRSERETSHNFADQLAVHVRPLRRSYLHTFGRPDNYSDRGKLEIKVLACLVD